METPRLVPGGRCRLPDVRDGSRRRITFRAAASVATGAKGGWRNSGFGSVDPANAPLTLDTVQVNACLDRARNALSTDTGTR